jgi:hypothetical protein
MHHLSEQVATATLGVHASYGGTFVETLRRWDLDLDAHYRSPTFTRTFFGVTNATEVVDDLSFYRVRQESQGLETAFSRGWANDRVVATLGVHSLRSMVEDTTDRFVDALPVGVDPRVFAPQYFAGISASLSANTFDNAALPRHGLGLTVHARGRQDLERPEGLSATLDAQLELHYTFDNRERVVVSTAASVAQVLGRPEFFDLPSLGGDTLRAYFDGQLTGNTSVAQQTDLRFQLFDHIQRAPLTGGVTLGVDHGRVWSVDLLAGQGTWHVNAGGGVWLTLVERMGIAVDWYGGPNVAEGQDQRVMFSLGPLFHRVPAQ